jgi:hypothetical protein
MASPFFSLVLLMMSGSCPFESRIKRSRWIKVHLGEEDEVFAASLLNKIIELIMFLIEEGSAQN